MEYSWNVKTLEKRRKQLYYMKCSTHDSLERSFIERQIDYLSSCIDDIKDEDFSSTFTMLSLLDRLKDEDDFLDPYFPILQDCILFSSITGRGSNYQGIKRKLDLSHDGLIQLSHDFYKQVLPKDFFLLFSKIFQKRFDHIRFSSRNKNCGVTLFIPSFEEFFVESQYEQDFSDIVTLIHELAHCIHFLLNCDQQMNLDLYPFWEFFSTFIELVAFDYFKCIKDFSHLSFDAEQISWNYWKEQAYLISLEVQLLFLLNNKVVRNNRHLKLLASQIGIDSALLERILRQPRGKLISNITSYSLAIELFYIYQNDKDEAWEVLRKIFLSEASSITEFQRMLTSLNINLNEHVNSYNQSLTRERKK